MMQNMKAFVDIVVKDKDGKVIKRIHKRSRSFVIQLLQTMFSIYSWAGIVYIYDNVGAAISFGTTNGNALRADAGAGVLTSGINVGRSSQAVTNTDYMLITPITNGSGANQLNYGSQAYTAPAVIGANVDFICTRSMTNNSGNPITINEVAFYVLAISQTKTFCLIRDLATVTVNNGQTVTVTYTLRTTA